MGSDVHPMNVPSDLPLTLGELRASGWVSRPVKEEVRENAVASIAAGSPLFEGVLGYEDTVMPQLENALLAGHKLSHHIKTQRARDLGDGGHHGA